MTYPVPLTILNLVVFAVVTAALFWDSTTPLRARIPWAIMVVMLANSIKTALADQHEQDTDAFASASPAQTIQVP